MATFWRHLHREGHRLLEKFDADPVREHLLQVHKLDGHIARMGGFTRRNGQTSIPAYTRRGSNAGERKHNSKTVTGSQNSYRRKAYHAKWAGWRKPQTETVGKRTRGVSQTAHSLDAHGEHLAHFLSDSLPYDTD